MASFVQDIWGRYINTDLIQYIEVYEESGQLLLWARLSTSLGMPDSSPDDRSTSGVVFRQLESGTTYEEGQKILREFVKDLER